MAIANLELERSDIEDIQEKKEDVTIYNFRVLKKWQEKEQSNATAQNLYNCLKSISVEVQDVLKGEQEILSRFTSNQALSFKEPVSMIECVACLFVSLDSENYVNVG